MLYEKIKKKNSNVSTNVNNNKTNIPIYFITVFDDGNSKYNELENQWIITGNPNPGKVTLLHKNSDITIKSISAWKVQLIENSNYNENK